MTSYRTTRKRCANRPRRTARLQRTTGPMLTLKRASSRWRRSKRRKKGGSLGALPHPRALTSRLPTRPMRSNHRVFTDTIGIGSRWRNGLTLLSTPTILRRFQWSMSSSDSQTFTTRRCKRTQSMLSGTPVVRTTPTFSTWGTGLKTWKQFQLAAHEVPGEMRKTCTRRKSLIFKIRN